MSDPRIQRALATFDRLNADDPKLVPVDGVERPAELVAAERLSAWVARLQPDASPALRLAARCQHLMRWRVRRDQFPEGRIGYLAWRKAAARFHADQAEAVLRAEGFDDATVSAVRRIVEKHGIKQNADVQTMEDALCLSFLEHELHDFARGHDDEKLIAILRRTWEKMSSRGHAEAQALLPRLSPEVQRLLRAALDAA